MGIHWINDGLGPGCYWRTDLLLLGAEGACMGDATLDLRNAVCFALLNAGAAAIL